MQETAVAENDKSHAAGAVPLRNGTARAALTSGTAEVITRVLAVVLSIATARVLEPREVGVLGVAVIVAGVVSMIGYYPETAAVAARGNYGDSDYALAASIIRACVIVCLLCAAALTFSPLAELLLGKEANANQLRQLLAILLCMPVLELIGGYASVILQRRLDLSYIAGIQLVQPVVFVSLAITLLIKGYGYIGVAWANIIALAITTAGLWFRLWRQRLLAWQGWPPLGALRETFFGSTRILAGGFGGYLGERLDNLLVAGAIGPTAMSFYSMAWNAARTPAIVFARAISFVLVPTIAQIQKDEARVQRAIGECLRHSYLLLAPVCAALFVSSPLLVSFVLGTKWLPLVPCLRIMAITVIVAPLLYTSGALLIGTGRAQLIGIATIAHLAALMLLVPILANRWGIIGAAYADMAATAILTVVLSVTAWRASRHINWRLIFTILLPMVAALSAGVAAWSIGASIPTDAARLIGELGMFLTGYPLFIFIFGGRARLFDLTAILRGVFRRSAVPAQQHS